jgi:hypothetical protein
VAQRADGVVDQALDAGVDRVGQLVQGKLAGDSAMDRLQVEAAESGEVSQRTRQRVELALADAVEQDGSFAEELRAAVAAAQRAAGPAVAAHGGVAVTGGVSATGSGVAIGGVTGGTISFGPAPPDPQTPGRT